MIEYLRGLRDDWRDLRDHEKTDILNALSVFAFLLFIFFGILVPASLCLWKGAMS